MTSSTAPLPRAAAERGAALLHWLTAEALPLWTTAGLAPDGTVWEALDHDGTPRPDIPRRIRVQARQAHVFARTAALPGAPEGLRPLARSLFGLVMDRGFDAEGRLVTGFAPDGAPLSPDHDLYDLAFVLRRGGRCGHNSREQGSKEKAGVGQGASHHERIGSASKKRFNTHSWHFGGSRLVSARFHAGRLTARLIGYQRPSTTDRSVTC